MKNQIHILIALFLVFALVLSGCTGTSGSSTSGSSTGGVLNLADIDPTTLDPAVQTELTSAQYIYQIFSGLLRLDDNLQPVPDIAAEAPTVSQDGLTYTFKLRQDVKFQDGRGVTANDFKYSWERAASPATNSQTAATYLGDIVGVSDVLSGKTTQISGVKIVDDYTLQITIISPESYFLYKLSYPTAFVVDKNNVNSGSNWWHKPNGTGPFKLEQWTLNKSLTLMRSDVYYGDKPGVSQVKYQFYSGLSMDLFETGQIDATGVSTVYYDKVMDKSGPFYQHLAVTPALSLYYIGFNCSQPPFDDINVRKAFSLAIDKDKIIALVFRGMEQKANGVLPVGIPGYNENLTGLGFDVNQAQQLMRSSRYGDVSKLPTITLTTYGYGGLIDSTLQAMVYQWKQNLGVEVNIRQLEPERYFYNTKSEIDQMFNTAWSADYPHPQDFLDILFSTGSNYNYGSYSNSEMDSLIQQANRTSDQNQSFSLYQQAEEKIVQDAACIPVTFGKNYTLTQPYIQSYEINSLGFATINKVKILPH